ncbi:MAG TPA: ATP-binding protein, partial [Polyangiaceae bacterium]|nr:ATP-binding protein [Polyangiaceae bacterium]
HLLTTAIDITARKRVEEALRESESRLRHAIDATGMGTWSRDESGVHWDEGMRRIFGISPEEVPKPYDGFIPFVHEEDRAMVAAAIERFRASGTYEDLEFRIVRKGGAVRHVLAKGAIIRNDLGIPIRSYGGLFDVTDQRMLEERLRQAQKMDAIGQLTAGIAHNFNNILAIILPSVELSQRSAPPEINRRLEDIKHASLRGADMVRDLMLFARKDVRPRLDAIDLGQTVRRTIDICRTTFDRAFVFDVRIEPSLPSARANAGQIEQVLLNVLLNARDALEEAKSPAPRISVELVKSREGTLKLTISDNGPGMDAATRARAFEPFFTTKGDKRGTGLGLASAYTIVAEHGGRISCESRLGEGTSIVIELVATTESPAAEAPTPRAQANAGSETVLLVDDEAMFRRTARDLLELEGYRVIEAADGVEAIRIAERELPRIDVVILDSSMPGASGKEVLRRLVQLDASLPVVLLSGKLGGSDAGPAAATLQKPVTAETLLGTVRGVLNRGLRGGE